MDEARDSQGIGASNLRGVTSRKGANNLLTVQSKFTTVAAVRDLIKAIGHLLVIVAVERGRAILMKAVLVNGGVNHEHVVKLFN